MKILKGLLTGLILTVIAIPCIIALPSIVIDFDAIVTSAFYTYIRAGMYFLPLRTVSAILLVQVTIWLFRIIVAIVRTVWDLLPFV